MADRYKRCETCDLEYEDNTYITPCPRCVALFTKYPELKEYIAGLRTAIEQKISNEIDRHYDMVHRDDYA